MTTQQDIERGAAFKQWQELMDTIMRDARDKNRRAQDEGWRLAAMVGIPHCGCSLHNASIDDEMMGWCKDNPTRLRVAKVANEWVNTWTFSREADIEIKLQWNRLIAEPFKYAKYTDV